MTHDSYAPFAVPEDVSRQATALLRRAYATVPPPAVRESMDTAVFAHISHPPATSRRRVRLLDGLALPGLGRRALSLVVSLAVVVTGLTTYLRLESPAPVSAQPVLRRAAAVRLAPNSVAHLTYAVTVTFGGDGKGADSPSGTADVWIAPNASGTPVSSAQTLTLDVKNIFSRYIQTDGLTYSYNPELRGDNTIAISTETPFAPSWLVPNHLFDGATVAQYLNSPGQQQGVQLLPQQSLDGHTVDVIQVDGGADRPALRTTFYFDAQSYLLRGFDATGIDSSYPIPSWRARLTGETMVPASSVSPQTFTLNAPSNARIDLPAPDSSAMNAAFQVTCHGALNLKAAMGTGRTPLAVCQSTNSGVTQAQLVGALIAPLRHDLDQAVAGGQVSSQQATTALAALQSRVTGFVTTARLAK